MVTKKRPQLLLLFFYFKNNRRKSYWPGGREQLSTRGSHSSERIRLKASRSSIPWASATLRLRRPSHLRHSASSLQ